MTTQTQSTHLKGHSESDTDPVQNGTHQLQQQAKKHTMIVDAVKSLWAADKITG